MADPTPEPPPIKTPWYDLRCGKCGGMQYFRLTRACKPASPWWVVCTSCTTSVLLDLAVEGFAQPTEDDDAD